MINLSAGLGQPAISPWDTRRLWSLWDMINFSLDPLLTALDLVRGQKANAAYKAMTEPHTAVDEVMRSVIANNIAFMDKVCRRMRFTRTPDRIARINNMFMRRYTFDELENELKVLIEAVEDDVRDESFYHYPRDRAALLVVLKQDWAPALLAFKDILADAEAATDCYALDRNDACGFHSMRVLEHGLRALATDVGRTFELQQWGNIIDEIESSIRAEERALPKGSAKNDRLEFLSKAAREFFYFKEGWRNHVSHNRTKYDTPQALSILTHVRDFMNHLSNRLSD
jgi:hypothetical protein